MYEYYGSERLAQQRATQIAREAEILRRRTERPVSLGSRPAPARTGVGVLANLAQGLRRYRPAVRH